MSKFLKQTNNAYKFYKDTEAQKRYNDEIVNKTWYYQKKFGFKINPRQGHEFWNVEADAFKHAFIGADMYFNYSDMGSLLGGVYHENQTPHNPQGEWNMDSWNNNQGREVAKEIEREYGDKFMQFSQQQRDDIIAVKIMNRMRNEDLITHPDDPRQYNGKFENFINGIKTLKESTPKIPVRGVGYPYDPTGSPTGFGADINSSFEGLKSILSKEDMAQVYDTFNISNPAPQVFIREDIGAMSQDEFIQNEDAIMKQLKEMGIPTKAELYRQKQKSSNHSHSSSSSSNGSNGEHWVTINGNHVLLDK